MIFTYALFDAIAVDKTKTVTRRPVWSGKPGRLRRFNPPAVGELLPLQRGYAKPTAWARVTGVVREDHFYPTDVSDAEGRREGFAGRAAFVAAWRAIYGHKAVDVWRIEFVLLPGKPS